MTATEIETWVDVCSAETLIADRGVCALVGGRHVALFLLSHTGDVFALSNIDPFSGASVMARGLVGDRAGTPKVSSPVYKQSFDLRSGICLDDPAVALAVFDVRLCDGRVEVRAT